MERIDPENEDFVVLGEHVHRYRWAARFARGEVLDVACGMGYGSEIILSMPPVTRYVGIDIDQDTIGIAKGRYADPEAEFIVSTCENIPLASCSIDTIISLETLEHLDDPELAVKEYARLLRNDGLLVGSVPDISYEASCSEVYGENPFHKSTFSEDALRGLLNRYFTSVLIYRSALELVSIVSPTKENVDPIRISLNTSNILGSILFIASNGSADRIQLVGTDIEVLGSLVMYDELYLVERDRAIEDQRILIDERDALILKNDMLITELRRTIKDQAKLIDERDVLIQQQDMLVAEFRETISSQAKLVDERDFAIRENENLISELRQAVEAQSRMIDERDQLIQMYESKLLFARNGNLGEDYK